jgi:hypothetical protein
LESDPRWLLGGWATQREATAAFSALISQAQANGLLPGQPLPEEHREALNWLLGGHPRVRELWSEKVSYFTFRERYGRPGRFGFVLVDVTGFERPFSMTACLTGVERLPVLVTEEEVRMDPFKGLVS